MHTKLTYLFALTALAAAVPAQEAPPPSPKLKAFDGLVGYWEGKGEVVQMQGQPATPWTATIAFQPILDGYFFQEDVEVQVGAPTPLQMRTIYGWDAENERYVAFGLGNTGESHYGTADFPEPGVMVTGHAGPMQGTFGVNRVVWRFGDGKMRFHADRANGAGAFFVEVQGAFQRIDAAPKSAAEASFVGVPIATQITKLAPRLTGTYSIRGAMRMTPDMPEMKITGTETIALAFGGHAVTMVVEGNADGGPPYVGHNYMVWNAADSCYDFVGFDNMGMCGKMSAWMVDADTIVAVHGGKEMGQPVAARATMKIGKAGLASWTNHSIVGAAEPMQSFHATYTREQ